jgi:hypothetical protein
MAQIEKWCENALATTPAIVERLLSALDNGYEHGDDAVRNLIDVSFVEELPYPDEPSSEIREMLPPNLRSLLRHG